MSDPNNAPKAPRCVHLTSKAMIVHGEDFEDDPEFQDGLNDCECTKTLHMLGPDGGEATLEYCSNPNRKCYEEY